MSPHAVGVFKVVIHPKEHNNRCFFFNGQHNLFRRLRTRTVTIIQFCRLNRSHEWQSCTAEKAGKNDLESLETKRPNLIRLATFRGVVLYSIISNVDTALLWKRKPSLTITTAVTQ